MTVQVATNVAKISRPKISGIFPRKRLFDELNALQDQTAVWLSSPPGAGKTSLVCDYIDQQSVKTVWYQVDEGDADIPTFFYYLGQAVQKATPRKRSQIPILTPEYSQNITNFTRNFFRTVFARFSDDFIFVFDNYQELGEETELHKLLVIALKELPDNGSIIIISRTHPPAEYSRLRANKQLTVLDWEQLRLSTDEMQEIFESKGIPQKNLHSVMAVTQGWIAGLTLLFEQDQHGETTFLDEHLSEFNPHLLFDYFVSEVFNLADEETQRFLVKTAWFPKMTVEMAVQLSGIKSASHILEKLVDKNFFTHRHGNKEIIYEYHPLFREFLLTESKKLLGEIELNVSKWNAAELLEKNHQIEAAIKLYLQLEDWTKVAEIIKKTASSLLVQGRNFILQEWLSKLPEQQLDDDPWLKYWLAMATIDFAVQVSLPIFEQAFKQFKQQNDVTGSYLAWAGIAQSIRMDFDGNANRLDYWFIQLDELRERYPEFPSAEIEAEISAVMFTALWWRQPQNKNLYYWRERALAAASNLPTETKYTIWVNSVLILHLIFSGETAKANKLLNENEPFVTAASAPPSVIIFFHIANILLKWRRGDFESAYMHVDTALKFGESSGYSLEHFQLLALGASVALTAGNMALAKQYIDKHEIVDHGVKGSRYHYLRAYYELFENNLEAANIHAQQSVEIAEKSGVPFFLSLSYLELSCVRFALGQYNDCLKLLKKCQDLAKEIDSGLLICSSTLIDAKFAFETDQYQKGLKKLGIALSMARERKYIGANLLSLYDYTKLCVEALKASIEVEHVQLIIRNMALIPTEEALSLDNWPWPIRIFCLDNGFEIQKNDQPISTSRKTQKKPLLVIKSLIAFGGQKVPESKIIEALWPDSDGDTGHQALATTLHRLRKLLGDNIIELKEGHLSLNKDLVWVDAWAFEHAFRRYDKTDTSSIETALALYKRQFLEEDRDSYWSINLRAKLHHMYLSLIDQLGSIHEQNNSWKQASECYLQGLEIDMMAEQFYQRLMQCYIEMDRAGDAVKTYRQCFHVLNKNLGVEPSNEIKTLLSKIQV